MNIVLIHPYITVSDPQTYLSEPLGLVCLASYLRQALGDAVQVTILDLYVEHAYAPRRKGERLYVLGEDNEAIIAARLKPLAPDLIGITCNLTAYADDALEVAAIARRALPSVPIVMGGAHPTIEAESILRTHRSVDFIVRGEGEITLEQLVHALQDRSDPATIAGLSWRRNDGSVVSNPRRALIEDLDVLPIPDRRFIDMQRYKTLDAEVVWYTRQKPVATLMTTRGCPYQCTFCSTNVVWERRWRERSLENVFAEIDALARDYGVRKFVIDDDMFWTQRRRVEAFCDHFIALGRGYSFTVDSGASPWLLNAGLLQKMKHAGFYALRFTIETGCERTMKYIRKPIHLDQARKLIEDASAMGYWTSANFIIGFPDETREEIEQTIRYAYACPLDFTSFIVAKPNAGAKLYEDFRASGLLQEKLVRSSDYYTSSYNTNTLSAAEINAIVADSHRRWFAHKLRFYLTPRYWHWGLWPKLRCWGDWRYLFKMVWVVFQRKLLPALRQRFQSPRPPGTVSPALAS